MVGIDQIDRLTGGKLGVFDVACPACGPERRSPTNRKRKVLRIWRIAPAFASFHCARCGLDGFARDGAAPQPDAAERAKARAEAWRFGEETAKARRRKARWLWSLHRAAANTVVETYLREVRCYGGALPPTIGFLPPRDGLPATMIAAFGFSDGEEAPADIQAVHLTRLAPGGLGKAGTKNDKIMIGMPRGTPIVLAPINDGLGLAIVEGIEDGLSIYEATGLGTWAAGCAPFLPALAETVPSYVEAVSIVADPDEAGRRFAQGLALGLRKRRIGRRVLVWGDQKMGHAA